MYEIFGKICIKGLCNIFCFRKKVIIHVPYRVKKVKHTHTIYKIIPHHSEAKHREDNDDTVYYDDEHR